MAQEFCNWIVLVVGVVSGRRIQLCLHLRQIEGCLCVRRGNTSFHVPPSLSFALVCTVGDNTLYPYLLKAMTRTLKKNFSLSVFLYLLHSLPFIRVFCPVSLLFAFIQQWEYSQNMSFKLKCKKRKEPLLWVFENVTTHEYTMTKTDGATARFSTRMKIFLNKSRHAKLVWYSHVAERRTLTCSVLWRAESAKIWNKWMTW